MFRFLGVPRNAAEIVNENPKLANERKKNTERITR